MQIFFNEFSEQESDLIKMLYSNANKILNLPEAISLNLVMVDEATILEMNSKYRGVNRVTDVLSFPMINSLDELENEIDVELGDVNIGDIYICRSRAMQQAEEYGHSYEREVAFLALHGLLHLLGYDHVIEEEEKEMFKLQDEILEAAQIWRD